MIKKEFIEINGTKFRRTYSDENLMIERDGVQYSEAIDPIGLEDRVYTETDILIEVLDEEDVEVMA
jgi:hypothetical protein